MILVTSQSVRKTRNGGYVLVACDETPRTQLGRRYQRERREATDWSSAAEIRTTNNQVSPPTFRIAQNYFDRRLSQGSSLLFIDLQLQGRSQYRYDG